MTRILKVANASTELCIPDEGGTLNSHALESSQIHSQVHRMTTSEPEEQRVWQGGRPEQQRVGNTHQGLEGLGSFCLNGDRHRRTTASSVFSDSSKNSDCSPPGPQRHSVGFPQATGRPGRVLGQAVWILQA